MDSANKAQKKLYEIIIQSILNKIEENNFSFEHPICTESQLIEEFQVSRITAKRAITELEHQGILYRKRGVGSFVARDIFQKREHLQTPPQVFAFVLPFTIKQENVFGMISKINAKISNSNCFLSLFISDGSRSKEQTILKQLLEQNIAGLLFYPLSSDIHLELLNQFVFRNIPVIVMDQPTTAPYLYNVLCDNISGGQQLTEHLISLGHQKISFFSSSNMSEVASVSERLDGYLKALKNADLSVVPEYIIQRMHDTSEKALTEQISILRSFGVTGIVCENDGIAQQLMNACIHMGLSIPKDLSICGFSDDFENITSICQHELLMAEHIGDIFLDALSSGQTSPHKILVPAELRLKSSTGPAPDVTVSV